MTVGDFVPVGAWEAFGLKVSLLRWGGMYVEWHLPYFLM